MLDEWDDSGGLERGALERTAPGPMSGEAVAMDLGRGLVVETTLEPREQPFLRDHCIDDTPVLPGVMGIEAFAEAALLLLPEWHVSAVEQVRFLSPFKLYRNEPRSVSVEAMLLADGEDLVAHCRLIGRRRLPGRDEPAATTHFTGRVRLSRDPVELAPAEPPPADGEATLSSDPVYRIFFHGPAYQVLDCAWAVAGALVGRMKTTLGPNHHPEEAPTVFDPRQIELCFQTAGLWVAGQKGRLGLPMTVRRVRIGTRQVSSEGPLMAVVRPRDGAFDARVVDQSGSVLLSVEGYRTVELPRPLSQEDLEPLRAAVETAEGEGP
jgi:hypothetical protein